MRTKPTNTLILLTLITLFSTQVQSAVVETVYSSAREMALAGAFVANVNGAPAIAINPAGIAPSTQYDLRKAELTLTASYRNNKNLETDKHTEQDIQINFY